MVKGDEQPYFIFKAPSKACARPCSAECKSLIRLLKRYKNAPKVTSDTFMNLSKLIFDASSQMK